MGPSSSRDDLLERLTPPAGKSVGAPEAVAAQIRLLILAGELAPGSRLDEEKLRARFECSRSTLREAYRLLGQHRLIEHHLSRGVFVRELSLEDVHDLFSSRRLIECALVDSLSRRGDLDTDILRRLGLLTHIAREAGAAGEWRQVMRADLLFHTHLLTLGESKRIAAFGTSLMSELHLASSLMANAENGRPRTKANEALLDSLLRRDYPRARATLDSYLRDWERSLRAPAMPLLTRRRAS